MELALGISILGLQLIIVGWLLSHSLQCGRVRERLTRLETRMGVQEGR